MTELMLEAYGIVPHDARIRYAVPPYLTSRYATSCYVVPHHVALLTRCSSTRAATTRLSRASSRPPTGTPPHGRVESRRIRRMRPSRVGTRGVPKKAGFWTNVVLGQSPQHPVVRQFWRRSILNSFSTDAATPLLWYPLVLVLRFDGRRPRASVGGTDVATQLRLSPRAPVLTSPQAFGGASALLEVQSLQKFEPSPTFWFVRTLLRQSCSRNCSPTPDSAPIAQSSHASPPEECFCSKTISYI